MNRHKNNNLSVGVIGKDNHALRLIKILEKSDLVEDIKIYYHRDYKGIDPRVTNDLQTLFSCNAIIIASPTPSHVEYIQKLTKFTGYILVEKPLVTNIENSKYLLNLNLEAKQRIKVNYSFIDSPVFRKIKEIVTKNRLGAPIEMAIRMGHGFAYSDKYIKNWISTLSTNGVAEQTGVHFINAAIHLFGGIVNGNIKSENFSGNGDVPDTSMITLDMANKARVNIFVSYSVPYQFDLLLTCTDGLYRYDGVAEHIHEPRNYYDEDGRFISPPKTYENSISYRDNWDIGLENSITEFLKSTISQEPLNLESLNIALSTMEPIFENKIHTN